MTRILNFLWNALFLLSTTPLWATEAPLIFQRAEGQRQPRPEEISYVRDSTQSLGWEDIQKPEYQEKFALIPTKTPNFNFTLDTIWLRLKIASADPVATKRYLSVSYAVLDRVEFFHVDAQGQIKAHFVTGDTLPVKSRAVRDASFVFPVLQEPEEVSTIYLKVQSRGSVNIPLTLWNEEEYYAARQHRFSLQSVYIGAIAAMFLYNLILSLTTRQKTYFFYIGYIFMYFLFISIMNGYFPLMLDNLIPDMPHIAFVLDHLLLVAITANNLFSLLFTFSFLHLSKAHNPISYRIILGFIGIAVLFTLLAHVLPFAPTIAFSAAFSSLTCVVMLGVGIACLLGGYQEARYYVAAWLVYNLGGIIYGLVLAGRIPSTEFTSNAQQAGQLFEVILLSFALADRLNTLQKQNIAAMTQNADQQIALRLETETRLELATGVAHRINNPLHAINLGLSDAIHHLNTLKETLTSLLGNPEEDDEERAAARHLVTQQLAGINLPLHQSMHSLELASSSIQEIRLLSGIDGYPRSLVDLSQALQKAKEDLRKNFGEDFLQRLSLSEIGSAKIIGNDWILKNLIELFLQKGLQSSPTKILLELKGQEPNDFSLQLTGCSSLPQEDFSRLRNKLQYLAKPTQARTNLILTAEGAWVFSYHMPSEQVRAL